MPTEPAADPLEAQLAPLKAELARLADLLAQQGRAEAETLRDGVEAGAERLRARGADGLAQAGGWLRDHPGQALGLAAGCGFLLGLLIGRR